MCPNWRIHLAIIVSVSAMLMFERLLFFLEVEIAVFEDGVEPEWLLEPPPTPAARV